LKDRNKTPPCVAK